MTQGFQKSTYLGFRKRKKNFHGKKCQNMSQEKNLTGNKILLQVRAFFYV